MAVNEDAYKALPSVGTMLNSEALAPIIQEHGRQVVTTILRSLLNERRVEIQQGRSATPVTPDAVDKAIRGHLAPSLRKVINGTGVVLHTNLGRAPLADHALKAMLDVSRYCSLELELSDGRRGDRHNHVKTLLTGLLGAQDAMVVNNCAAALFLLLTATCKHREVIIARSELVEIGGGFRIPDVLRESGAELVEVGTTNKVYVEDYQNALSDRTAAIVRVHRSNFAMLGFTHEPTWPALSALAREANVPLYADVGSGLLADASDLENMAHALESEPKAQALLAAGVDTVAFSGDKLLGGPQAGILAGRTRTLSVVRRHPLTRALRLDKCTLAALEATLQLYRDGHARKVPAVAALVAGIPEIEARARKIQDEIRSHSDLSADIIDCASAVGGGCLPLLELPSRAVVVGETGAEGRMLAENLRKTRIPLLTRTLNDRTGIDARTIEDKEVPLIGGLLHNVQREATLRATDEAIAEGRGQR